MSEKDLIDFRIITIGDSNVGKTSIIRRYIDNKFDENFIATIGLIFSFKEVILKNQKKVRLKLIDTAGQEKYKSLSKSYFKNADGVLFVFSFEDIDSFDHLKEWINSFKESQSKERIPCFLIGNKNDLPKKVNKDDINQFLTEYNDMKFEETSAKENISINKVFEDMAELLYEDYIKSGGKNKKQKSTKLKDDTKKKKNSNCICTKDADV